MRAWAWMQVVCAPRAGHPSRPVPVGSATPPNKAKIIVPINSVNASTWNGCVGRAQRPQPAGGLHLDRGAGYRDRSYYFAQLHEELHPDGGNATDREVLPLVPYAAGAEWSVSP